MAEVIQFPCPACGVQLRLPIAMAACHGPCPRCGVQIIAPDPATGRGAHLPEPEPPAAAPDPPIEAPAHLPAAPITTLDAPRRSLKPSILLLTLFPTAILFLAAGYFIGIRSIPSDHSLPKTEVPVTPLAPETPEPTPPETPPEPTPPETPTEPAPPETPPEPEPQEKPEPVKASASAEATLKAFLDAPDWASRAAYVLNPDVARPAMAAHAIQNPDGPTPYQSIAIQNSYTDKSTGNTLFIFQVITDAHPTGIPVAVVETKSGWLVDWQTFVEFQDDLFHTFAEGPVDATGRFHLIVSTPPAPRAAKTENEYFSSFLLDPPLPDREQIAYVRKSEKIHDILQTATAKGGFFTPVLEVTKRKAPDGKTYLEITKIIANDWLPEGW